jgi:hypothetical protein
LLSLVAATGLITLLISGVVMWRRQAQGTSLGGPRAAARPPASRRPGVWAWPYSALGVFMPVLRPKPHPGRPCRVRRPSPNTRVRTWLGLDPSDEAATIWRARATSSAASLPEAHVLGGVARHSAA